MKSLFRMVCLAAMIANAGQLHAGIITISTSTNQLQAGVDNQGWVGSNSANFNNTNDNYITSGVSPICLPFDYKTLTALEPICWQQAPTLVTHMLPSKTLDERTTVHSV